MGRNEFGDFETYYSKQKEFYVTKAREELKKAAKLLADLNELVKEGKGIRPETKATLINHIQNYGERANLYASRFSELKNAYHADWSKKAIMTEAFKDIPKSRESQVLEAIIAHSGATTAINRMIKQSAIEARVVRGLAKSKSRVRKPTVPKLRKFLR